MREIMLFSRNSPPRCLLVQTLSQAKKIARVLYIAHAALPLRWQIWTPPLHRSVVQMLGSVFLRSEGQMDRGSPLEAHETRLLKAIPQTVEFRATSLSINNTM
ncbi:hypothetical protein K491DRAFT_86041 [Lophiostoma macrostomum CBS 122681]|uniref:Uncharacterized protein n=1 Tax=Lophiostoma macrostomum CBS 122681 TaxID=1314788 RepID=A0A6A6SV35_9PLEO|nr:hypothetical protein K491DRAFT_86041 [Lophiostoma macrostomum CBS 122681]